MIASVWRVAGIAAIVAFNGTTASGWEFDERIDRFTDQVTHSAKRRDSVNDATLSISCSKSSFFSISFAWLGPDYDYMTGGEALVRWRVGKRPAQSGFWDVVFEGRVVHDRRSARDFIAYVASGEPQSESLIADARQNEIEIDVAGFAAMIGELARRCDLNDPAAE